MGSPALLMGAKAALKDPRLEQGISPEGLATNAPRQPSLMEQAQGPVKQRNERTLGL